MYGYHEGYLVTPISTGTLVAGHILAGSIVASIAGADRARRRFCSSRPFPSRPAIGGGVLPDDLPDVARDRVRVVASLLARPARERPARDVRDHQRGALLPVRRALSRGELPALAATVSAIDPLTYGLRALRDLLLKGRAALVVLRAVDLPADVHARVRRADEGVLPEGDLDGCSALTRSPTLWPGGLRGARSPQEQLRVPRDARRATLASSGSTRPSRDEPGERLLERDRALLARQGDLLVEVLERVLADVLACPVARRRGARPRAPGRRPAAAAASGSGSPRAPSTAPGGSSAAARPETNPRCARRPTRRRSCGPSRRRGGPSRPRRARSASSPGPASLRRRGRPAPAASRRAARSESRARPCRSRPARRRSPGAGSRTRRGPRS